EDLNGAQLAQVYAQIEVAIDTSDGGSQERLHLGKRQTGDIHCSHLRQIDRSVAVDHQTLRKVDLSPYLNLQLVARANNMGRIHWNTIHGCERRRNSVKERCTEDGKHAAGGFLHKALEL